MRLECFYVSHLFEILRVRNYRDLNDENRIKNQIKQK